jgi:hypothetical protein
MQVEIKSRYDWNCGSACLDSICPTYGCLLLGPAIILVQKISPITFNDSEKLQNFALILEQCLRFDLDREFYFLGYLNTSQSQNLTDSPRIRPLDVLYDIDLQDAELFRVELYKLVQLW